MTEYFATTNPNISSVASERTVDFPYAPVGEQKMVFDTMLKQRKLMRYYVPPEPSATKAKPKSIPHHHQHRPHTEL